MSKQVRVTIGPDGKVKFEADGFVGSSCEEATSFLEKAFAGKSVSRELKPEYYEVDGSVSADNKLRF